MKEKKMQPCNRTEVKIFRSHATVNAKVEYNKFVFREKLKILLPGSIKIAVYFDEENDCYHTALLKGGECHEKDVFSWDEVSQLIYENS